MQNWGDVQTYVAAETDSAGLAQERYAIYLESVEAAQNKLTASWEGLMQATIESGAISWFYEFGASVLDATSKMGGLIPIAKTIIGLWVLFNAALVKTTLINAYTSLSSLGAVFKNLIPILMGTTVQMNGLAASTTAANVAALPFILTIGAITLALGYGIKVIKDYADAQRELRDEIAKTEQANRVEASSYDEYVKKTKEAAEAAGYFYDETGKMFHEGYHGAKVYVQGMDMITEAQWKGIQIAEHLNKTMGDTNETMSEMPSFIEEANVAYQSLAETISSITDMSDSLASIMEKSVTEGLDFSDIDELAKVYPDYLEALSIENGQLQLNTDLVREYVAAKAEQAVADAISAGATENEIAILQAYANSLREQQYAMIGAMQVTAGTAEQIFMAIAQEAAMSGNSFVDLQGKALTSANAIYSFLQSGDQAFNSFVQQAANATGMSVQQVMQAVTGMISTTYSNAVAAINDLQRRFAGLQGTIPAQVMPTASLGIFNAAPIGFQYPGGLGDYKKSSGGGGSSSSSDKKNKEAEKQRKIEEAIEKARKDAIDDLKEQLKLYKDIVDAKKEILDTLAEEREYQQDIDEQNQNILDIQNQLAALQFDDSEEGQARTLELQDQLNEAQQELEDTQYEHSIEAQKAAIDAEYEAFASQLESIIKQIEDINVSSVGGFSSKLAEILSQMGGNLPQFHDGVNSGVVGGSSGSSKSNEILAKVMKGELFVTPNQGDNFLKNILPNMAEATSNFNGGNLDVDMNFNVAGNLDKTVLPDLKVFIKEAMKEINNSMKDRGYVRTANQFSI